MQMEVNHRYAGGLVFSASYTLLDEVSSGVDANSSLGGTLYNQFRPGAETGPDRLVSRHRFVAYGTYDVPVGRHRQYLANLPKIAEGIRAGRIQTLIVFGEDVTRKGIPAELLAKLDLLIVSDILPNETTRLAHFLLPGCAHAEKRGTFTNTKGRVQRFMKAVEPPRGARPEWEFLHELVFNATGQDGFVSIEGLFNQMAGEVPAFNGLTWGALKDAGVTVPV